MDEKEMDLFIEQWNNMSIETRKIYGNDINVFLTFFLGEKD